MMLTLDDDTARISGDLVTEFKRAIAGSIQTYFGPEQINWSAVTTALMLVSADTNNIAKLDYDLALYTFTQFLNRRHAGVARDGQDDPLVLAANSGSVDTQLRLALKFQEGKDAPQDLSQAVRWFELAASNGSAVAQRKLGLMFAQGSGVSQDYSLAIQWLRSAADQGDILGQYNLGYAYSNGFGVPQDENEAIKWWTLAAEQGHDQAQHDIAWHYVAGEVLEKNYAAAHVWYRLAAAQGLLASQNNLGEMYLNGQGVPVDLIKAYMWFSLASRDGDQDALDSLADLETKMTAEQILEAQKMADDWRTFRPTQMALDWLKQRAKEKTT